jgi:DNA-binding winged helix-turn-helix (wHTH) protein
MAGFRFRGRASTAPSAHPKADEIERSPARRATDGSPMRADESPAIDLAREPEFALANLQVRPSTREVIAGEAREVLEPRVMQALVALAQRQGQVVSRDELIATCWDGRIVGEDAINGAIAKVRRLGEAHGAFTIETIPRVGYRLAVSGPTKRASRPGRLVWMASAVALLIMVLVGAAFWSMRQPTVRVAVLPFDTIPAGPQSQALAARVRDQITEVLTIRQVEVASRASSRSARLVVSGVVEQTGDTTRVRVHIDDPRSQTVLWQKVFEGDGGVDSPLPERTAAKVTDLVASAASVIRSSNGAIRPDALKAWMLGLDGGREGQAIEAMEFYRAFRDRAPNLSAAHSAFAAATLQAAAGQTPEVARVWRAEVESEAKRALQLDPRNAAAYMVLSQLGPPLDVATRQKWVLEGLRHAPNDGSLNTNEGLLLAGEGRMRESVPFIRRGLALDPLSPPKNFGTPSSLAAAGFVDEGRDLLARARRIWPDGPNELRMSIQFAVNFMSPDEGREMVDELLRAHPAFAAEAGVWRQYFGSLKCSCGQAGAAQRISAAATNGQLPLRLVLPAFSRLGELDLAFEFAARARPQFTLAEVWLLFTPTTAAMRRDPRFIDMAARFGLAEHWRSTNRWPDYCAEPGLPYDCKAEAARAVAQLRRP